MEIFIVLLTIFGFSLCCPIDDLGCGHTVEVGVYIESLCPDSKDFVLNQLYPTFVKLSKAEPPIMTINLVTFGNANIGFVKNSTKNPRITFNCQHGQQECEGNILQSCAVLKIPVDQSLAMVNCMFGSPDWLTPWDSGAECAKQLKLDWDLISQCANSEEGLAFEYFMGGQTLSLDPPHTSVPWVTIDGQHTDTIQTKAQTDLLKLVCDTYPGAKPDACKESRLPLVKTFAFSD